MNVDLQNKILGFFRQFRNKKFKKGDILISPSDIVDGLFFLETGVVRQYAISAVGDELEVNTFKAPAFFPVSWIINENPIRHYFEALNDVAVWVAPKNESRLFFESNPDVVFDLMQKIYKGLDGYFLKMESLMVGTARAKLLTYLLIYSRRFKSSDFKITEEQIAAGCGLSRETVSRQLGQLKTEGFVHFENGIITLSHIDAIEDEILF